MTLELGTELLKNFVQDAAMVRLWRRPRLSPLILAYFVTFRCNLRCTYCQYANGSYGSRYPDATTSQAKDILAICRQGVPAVAFSGGEPLLREDIVQLVKFAKSLGYKPISLFTNSLLLPEREEILEYVDVLQISLDTLDDDRQERISGRRNTAERIKDTIKKYAGLQSAERFRININCVVGADTLGDVHAVMDFAVDNNVRFTICPELDARGMPQKALLTGEPGRRYREIVDRVLACKSMNQAVLDIRPFLEHIKTFRSYRCYPTLAPRVYPDGSFVFPCPRLCRDRLNVLREASWQKLMEAVCDRDWACETPCFLPCYLETSLLVRHPFSILREL